MPFVEEIEGYEVYYYAGAKNVKDYMYKAIIGLMRSWRQVTGWGLFSP